MHWLYGKLIYNSSSHKHTYNVIQQHKLFFKCKLKSTNMHKYIIQINNLKNNNICLSAEIENINKWDYSYNNG